MSGMRVIREAAQKSTTARPNRIRALQPATPGDQPTVERQKARNAG